MRRKILQIIRMLLLMKHSVEPDYWYGKIKEELLKLYEQAEN